MRSSQKGFMLKKTWDFVPKWYGHFYSFFCPFGVWQYTVNHHPLCCMENRRLVILCSVFHRRKQIGTGQDQNNMRISKWWQNFHFRCPIPLTFDEKMYVCRKLHAAFSLTLISFLTQSNNLETVRDQTNYSAITKPSQGENSNTHCT